MKGFCFGLVFGLFYILLGNGGWEVMFGNVLFGVFLCFEVVVDYIFCGDCE